MKTVVVGAGYVGLVTAACLAESGNQVVGVDHDPARVAILQAGGVPIYEPGLEDMVVRNQAAGRLQFTTSMAQALDGAEVVFIAVGTPPREDGSADLQHVLAVARDIGMHTTGFKVVVNKSTVPVGTAARVRSVIRAQLDLRGLTDADVAVVSNPEFLKEGAAIDDFMRPDRIVVGVDAGSAGERARQWMTRLYAPFNRHHDRTVWMDVASAELTKYASNAMLATRISFMNEVALLADRLGADVDSVRRGMGLDPRIGHGFLYAGTGYGGSCFPKDTRALVHTAEQHGCTMQVVAAVERVNKLQKHALVDMVLSAFGSDLRGVRLAVWGLAFKPNTNDMREAPSRHIVAELYHLGATLVLHDPVAASEAQTALAEDLGTPWSELDRMQMSPTPMDALDGAHALIIVTEWKCFHTPDFHGMVDRLAIPLVLDGRNLYDPEALQEMGVAYHGIGRRNSLGVQALKVGVLPQRSTQVPGSLVQQVSDAVSA